MLCTFCRGSIDGLSSFFLRYQNQGFRFLGFMLKMETKKFEARQLLKDKRFWVASSLIVWAAALQGHMMWLQKQDTFKQKFGNPEPSGDEKESNKVDVILE